MSGRSGPAPLGTPALGEQDRSRCYLLFAGSHRTPHGGLADLVGAFTSEETARQAFQQIRLDQPSKTSWAQLAVVDGHHGICALSWFGIGATPARTPLSLPRPKKVLHTQPEGGVTQVATQESPSPAGPPQAKTTARRHGLKRIAAWLVALADTVAAVLASDGATTVRRTT